MAGSSCGHVWMGSWGIRTTLVADRPWCQATGILTRFRSPYITYPNRGFAFSVHGRFDNRTVLCREHFRMRYPKPLTTKWVEQIQNIARQICGSQCQCQWPYVVVIAIGVANTSPTIAAKQPATPIHAYRGANIIHIHATARTASRTRKTENQTGSANSLPSILNTRAAIAVIVVNRKRVEMVKCSACSTGSRDNTPQNGRSNSKQTARTRALPTK